MLVYFVVSYLRLFPYRLSCLPKTNKSGYILKKDTTLFLLQAMKRTPFRFTAIQVCIQNAHLGTMEGSRKVWTENHHVQPR